MSGLFVTATGTGIGKTLVTAAIARQLRRRGYGVRALKPVITGFADGAPSDTALLLEAQGLQVTPAAVAAISPWRFAPPVSPDVAAARAGRRLAAAEIAAFCRSMGRDGATLLVEGIGGVMVPLNERDTVLDWIGAAGLPVLLVAGSYLGTLSHTLSAASVLAARGVPPVAVVVSESADSPMPLDETVAALRRHLGETPVVALPRLARGLDDWERAPDLSRFAIPQGH